MKALPPKVFVSHASEDKERFVLNFATKLRALGIDAWLVGRPRLIAHRSATALTVEDQSAFAKVSDFNLSL